MTAPSNLGAGVLVALAVTAGGALAQSGPAAHPDRPQTVVPVPLAERIATEDPFAYEDLESVHGGPGILSFAAMFDVRREDGVRFDLGTNLLFLHRGRLQAGGGIGAHYHNYVEEMFVIFSGEAEFTVNGRTSLLQAPVGVPARLNSSHAIVNSTDQPVEWMNINVSLLPGYYDAYDLNDPRVGVEIDAVPQFIVADLSEGAMEEVQNFDGGSGAVRYNRALAPSSLFTAWSYVDRVALSGDATIGPIAKPDMSEVYYVISGSGEATIGGETVVITAGQAIPATLGEVRAFAATGEEPLDMMIIGVARDLEAKQAYMVSEEAQARR